MQASEPAIAEAAVASPQAPTVAEKPIESLLGGDADLSEAQNAPVDTTGLRRAVLESGAPDSPAGTAAGAELLAAPALREVAARLERSPAFAQRYGDLSGFVEAAVANELALFDAG